MEPSSDSEEELPTQEERMACLQEERGGESPLGQWCARLDRQRIDPGRRAFESPSEGMYVVAAR